MDRMGVIENDCQLSWRNFHDDFNLIALPTIILFNLLYLIIRNSAAFQIQYFVFLCYMVADSMWLFLKPESAASPLTVLSHHFICLIGWIIPLFEPKFRYWISLAVLVEVNTFFLTLRRRVRRSRLIEFLFWITWISCRLCLYSFLVVAFFYEYITYSNENQSYINLAFFTYLLLGFLCFLNIKWTLALIASTRKPREKNLHYL